MKEANSTASVSGGTALLVRLPGLLPTWQLAATAAHQAYASGQALGPVTGLPQIDQALGGSLKPGFHAWHGEPGTGKTALLLQIAASCGCPALFVSCEMSTLELFRRIVARVTGTRLGKLSSGEIAPEPSFLLANQAAAACQHLTLLDATRTIASPECLLHAAEAARGDHPHLLIVVDSVHSWADSSGNAAQEYDRLNTAVAALRSLAGRLDCPVVGIAERSRSTMQGGGLSAAAGSRKLEYGAETVIGLDRGKATDSTVKGVMGVTLSIEKNRHGSAGIKVPLRFHGAMQRFEEVSQRPGSA